MSKEEPIYQRFLFGGISCMMAAVVTNPIDVIKTRLQIQGELAKSSGTGAKKDGLVTGTLKIIQQEGIIGLYKGLSASLLREGTYSTLRMGGYDLLKSYMISDQDNGRVSLSSKILSGAISGAVGASIANPSDLIKVRLQADHSGTRYRSIMQAFREIIDKEGVRGLYKGVSATTQRAALLTASQIPAYDHIKHVLLDHNIIAGEGIKLHTVSSIFAGLVAATTTSPVDLIKTRIMNQPFDPVTGKGLLYSSNYQCLVKTVKAEGLLGLYKGFIPNWLRIGPHTIVTFIVYENLRKLFNISPI
ncbi:mitochondrial substrate carrier family protein [Tieghemostelium lacteum]|uniref:Mitochondrial substrate carrier family protein n=1 Tax=Tieghemostelium lacteum TaxID=361077 RepID=A0A151Z593_TIELA|nr:mitochondrial substrate carrier family protein [Tieghemostelium lacteum]|eukprot:KYQ89105.1 mitochondrial substrate carrier family protein [Tieghemostelium lacteum]